MSLIGVSFELAALKMDVLLMAATAVLQSEGDLNHSLVGGERYKMPPSAQTDTQRISSAGTQGKPCVSREY